MSKRNIARTAIEGGRAKHCREMEHDYTVSERREVTIKLRKIAVDPELADEFFVEYRGADFDQFEFADKLRPVKRWICSRVGRPWSEVYSEICTKFDKRSLAGRHIIDHIHGWIDIYGEGPRHYRYPVYKDDDWRTKVIIGWKWKTYFTYDYVIDEDGILRESPDEGHQ